MRDPRISSAGAPAHAADARLDYVLEAKRLRVSTRAREVLRDVSLRIQSRQIFTVIGPSGAGKTTLLRCLNRLVDLTPGLRVDGEVLFRGASIRAPDTDVDALRARMGMLFQQPVVFPMSIERNAVFGVRHLARVGRSERSAIAERALREAALWDEVKDRLHEPALRLSAGQQQRLCLARTLAVEPEVILMDEPTSALDPKSAEAIEDLILRLKERRSIVLVTHNLAQARRVSDWVACLCVRDGAGEMIESACCDALFSNPRCREVAEFLGRNPGTD
ncbi:MAG: phosphate ABC transporter ATP-binding protein [Opitutaceae bacterium]